MLLIVVTWNDLDSVHINSTYMFNQWRIQVSVVTGWDGGRGLEVGGETGH